MIGKQEKTTKAEIQPVDLLSYDSKPLTTALATLSLAEIESMLGHITCLEVQIAKLNTDGQEDAMMRLVTDGLRRLTYFLDMVKRHQDDNTEDEVGSSSGSI